MTHRKADPAWRIALAVFLLVPILGCPGGGGEPPTEATPTPSSTSAELGALVRLTTPQGTQPQSVTLSASSGADHIRWINETSETRTLKFTVLWPFMETEADIVVSAGATTPWYTFDPAKVSGGGRPFPYEVTPPLTPPDIPPDQPAISGEP
jgi:hypothetical protein